jgi:hypothetical protein
MSRSTLENWPLAKVQPESHELPRCAEVGGMIWFRGVLQDISIKYTMFMPNGTPVRATADCTFIEAETEAEYRRRVALGRRGQVPHRPASRHAA